MAFDIKDEIKRTFNLASLRHQIAKDFTSQEWKEYQKIREKYDDLRRFHQSEFEQEFKTRFEVARKKLIDQAGARNRDFKHRWFGRDQFDKTAINRQAERNVLGSHAQVMADIDNQEARETKQLLDGCKKRTHLREKSRRDFESSASRGLQDTAQDNRALIRQHHRR